MYTTSMVTPEPILVNDGVSYPPNSAFRMVGVEWDQVREGDIIPLLTLRPIDRTVLALFAGASGDHNPIHIDIDFARRAGMPDVFAHGMLGMAWLGRLLTNWAPQVNLKKFAVRFEGIMQLGHVMTCSGSVEEKIQADGQQLVRLRLQATNQYGETKISGEALVAFIN